MSKLVASIKQKQVISARVKQQKFTAHIKTGGHADQRIDYQSADFATLLKLQTGIA